MALLSALSTLSADDRKSRLKDLHPLVESLGEAWQVLLDAYEGLGGYLDGGHLWRFPSELVADFTDRQKQARYHNYARQIINLYVRYAFGGEVDRQAETDAGQRYLDWTTDVDGAGTSLTDFLRRQTRLALAQGQQGVLVDKTPDAPTGPSLADQRARVVLRRFGMSAILDWRHDTAGQLASLKLSEALEQQNVLEEPLDDERAFRYLIWDREVWLRLDVDGAPLEQGEQVHGLGFVPFIMLRPEPSATELMIGQSILGHPNLIRSLYNRASEEDVVLRGQAFSTLVCEVNDPAHVEDTKAQIGRDIGTNRAIVVNGAIKYITADMAAPKTIQDAQKFLVQELMRTAHMRFQRDSLDAESAEAIRLQHAELNEMLKGLASELERVEHAIARAWFAWESPGQEDAALEQAQVTAKYPKEFFVKDLAAELDAIAQAISIDYGATYTHELKKASARSLTGAGMGPALTPEQWEVVDSEIDAQTEAAPGEGDTVDALRQRSVERLTSAFAAREEEA